MSKCQVRLWRSEKAVPANVCSPWRAVSIWSLFVTWSEWVVCTVGIPKVFKQSSVQQVFSLKVWGAVRAHTCPNPQPIPESQNTPIYFLWCFKRQMEYKGHVDIFFSCFWKWCLLRVGSMVSKVLWPLGFKLGLKSLTKLLRQYKCLLFEKQMMSWEEVLYLYHCHHFKLFIKELATLVI